jgi:hypothetical protein
MLVDAVGHRVSEKSADMSCFVTYTKSRCDLNEVSGISQKLLRLHQVLSQLAQGHDCRVPESQALEVKISFETACAVITSPVSLILARGRTRMINEKSGATVSVRAPEPNAALIQAIVQAEFWRSNSTRTDRSLWPRCCCPTTSSKKVC